jgi:hypothetical protein
MMNNGKKAIYKTTSLAMAVLFAGVGVIFLMLPAGLIEFFNRLSGPLGMKPAPLTGHQFFLVLAVSYMYCVTLLAWFMFRHPHDKIYPLLLAQAKAVSSILSFLFFILHQPFLIYLTNGVVDGAIAVLVFVLYLRMLKPS